MVNRLHTSFPPASTQPYLRAPLTSTPRRSLSLRPTDSRRSGPKEGESPNLFFLILCAKECGQKNAAQIFLGSLVHPYYFLFWWTKFFFVGGKRPPPFAFQFLDGYIYYVIILKALSAWRRATPSEPAPPLDREFDSRWRGSGLGPPLEGGCEKGSGSNVPGQSVSAENANPTRVIPPQP